MCLEGKSRDIILIIKTTKVLWYIVWYKVLDAIHNNGMEIGEGWWAQK